MGGSVTMETKCNSIIGLMESKTEKRNIRPVLPANLVWLAVNYNNSATSGELIR